MEHQFSGRILYASGRPAAGVRVRVFDKDAPGKGDDDLTVQEGLSSADGEFTVSFAPSRFRDFKDLDISLPRGLPFDWAGETLTRRLPDMADVYLPHLLFQYSTGGVERSHTVFLRPFKHEFRLSESPAIQFQPSVHGLKFVNRFRGYFIPFSVPSLPDIPSVKNIYGMCGGMAATALDLVLLDRPIPGTTEAPKRKTPLHKYIYRRQIDSFGPFGDQIVRFARWMMLPDDTQYGTWKKCAEEFDALRGRLDDGNPLPIGLVYVSARETKEIWQNHQVLAYGYREPDAETIELLIYDPNYPLRDDVLVRSRRVSIPAADPQQPPLSGLQSEQWVGDKRVKPVRGYFCMPYVPVEPPGDL